MLNRLSAYTANTYANDAANWADTGCSFAKNAANPCPDPKGIYTRNQFGFSAGGPIKKDKLFIFESTEWTRVRSAATETEEIFDPAFIKLMPTNIQAYYTDYGQTTLPSAGVASTVGQVAAQGFNIGLINGKTALPMSTPMFDTVNFKTPFDAGGGTPQNTYALVGAVWTTTPQIRPRCFSAQVAKTLTSSPGTDTYSAYPQYNTGTTYVNQSYLYSVVHTFTPNLLLSTKVKLYTIQREHLF